MRARILGPRVLWVGVGEGAQQLCALHDGIEPPLLELGCYRREERQYAPHITLGRVKTDRPPDRLAAALAKHACLSPPLNSKLSPSRTLLIF